MDRHTIAIIPGRDEGWTVYAVTTGSSRYHLAVFKGDSRSRACAVLRGESRGLGRIEVQDSNPLIGGHSLFTTATPQWIGEQLEIGTVKTSPLVSVDLETNDQLIRSMATSATLALRSDVRATAAVVAQPPARSILAAQPVSRSTLSGLPEAARPPARPQRTEQEEFVDGIEQAATWLRWAYTRAERMVELRRQPELLERARIALMDCQTRVVSLVARAKA